MPDLGSLLEREMQEIRPADYTIGDVAHRRDRRRRNQRLGTAVVALVIAVAAIGGLVRAFEDIRSDKPAGSTGAGVVMTMQIHYLVTGD